MDAMYFSPIHSAGPYPVNGYEISSKSSLVCDDFSLHVSCTTTGNLTFTLTLVGTPGSALLTQECSMWTDTILTYRSREAPKPWQNIAGNTTLRRFVISKLQSLSPVVETPDGETFYETAQMHPLFWHELKSTIRAICASLWDDFLNFASGGSEVNDPAILDEVANSFWSQMSFETGQGYP